MTPVIFFFVCLVFSFTDIKDTQQTTSDIDEPYICNINQSKIIISNSNIFCNNSELEISGNIVEIIGNSNENDIFVNKNNKLHFTIILNQIVAKSLIIDSDATVHIRFEGQNKIINQMTCENAAKVELSNSTFDSKIIIYSQKEGEAAIGCKNLKSLKCKSVTFIDGKIEAFGGIGQNVESIFIKGGEITSHGLNSLPGIGGFDNIEISGGFVNSVGENGVGIGDFSTAKSIKITGGKIKATGGKDFAAIEAKSIFILGGEINAIGGENAAAIGSSSQSSSFVESIIIADATILATGGDNGAGIGCGANSSIDEIKIYDGDIDSIGGINAAGIGTGNALSMTSNVKKIYIYGGDITANGGKNAAGIGGSNGNSNVDLLIIAGGIVTATGGSNGAGIGGGKGDSDSKITSMRITGGEINSRSGENSNGIGCGQLSLIFSLSITGGIITATPTSKEYKGIGSKNLTLLEIFGEKDYLNENYDKYKCLKIITQNGFEAKTTITQDLSCNLDKSICELSSDIGDKCVKPWNNPVNLPSDLVVTTAPASLEDNEPEATLRLHNMFIVIPAIVGSFIITGIIICFFLQLYLKKQKSIIEYATIPDLSSNQTSNEEDRKIKSSKKETTSDSPANINDPREKEDIELPSIRKKHIDNEEKVETSESLDDNNDTEDKVNDGAA